MIVSYFRLILHPIFQRYFAHPENLLMCGLLSPFSTDYVRQKCLEKILEARKKQKRYKTKNVRKFFPPSLDKFNFDANNIFDLLKWNNFKKPVTPPPLLKNKTDNELKEMLLRKCTDFDEMLCHSQHNERCVKVGKFQNVFSIWSNPQTPPPKPNH